MVKVWVDRFVMGESLMQRRTFLRSLFGPLGLLAASAVRAEEVEGHIFDWTGYVPETTDPKYKGKLTWGRHNHVICNGVELSAPTRFQVGLHGWVEQFYRDREDRTVIEVLNQWEGDMLCSYPLPIWQVYDPNRKDKDGNLIPKYRERIKTVITRGHVIYWNDHELYNRVSVSGRTVEVERLACFLDSQPEVFDA